MTDPSTDKQIDVDLAIAEAAAKAEVALCIQTAVMRFLFRKEILTGEDASTIASEVAFALENSLEGDAAIFGRAVLRGCTAGWMKAVVKN